MALNGNWKKETPTEKKKKNVELKIKHTVKQNKKKQNNKIVIVCILCCIIKQIVRTVLSLN